jgi:plasmid stabilization system protein ParE
MSSCGGSGRSTRYRTRLAPRAPKDVEEIYSLIACDSPLAAERWYEELTRAIASLSTFPFRCPIVRVGSLEDRELHHLVFGNYRILFTIDEGRRSVDVLRVWHGARHSITRSELDQA